MKFLITAGPTREPIDQVRYISNFSSGKMGYSIAESARKRKHEVMLITGPVNVAPLKGIIQRQVETTLEMKREIERQIPHSDCLIMTAAVSDYRPAKVFKGKMKKDKKALTLKLIRNPDILKEIGAKTRNKILVGFALESDNLLKNAVGKLREKNLDYIIANSPNAFGSNNTSVIVISRYGIIKRLKNQPKTKVADFIIRLIENDFMQLR